MNPDQDDQNKTQSAPPISATPHGTEGGSVGLSEQGPLPEGFLGPSGAEVEPRIDSAAAKAGVNVSPQFRHDQSLQSSQPASHVALPQDPETLRAMLKDAKKKEAAGSANSGQTWIGILTQFGIGKFLMRLMKQPV